MKFYDIKGEERFSIIHGFRFLKMKFQLYQLDLILRPDQIETKIERIKMRPFETISYAWASGKTSLIHIQRNDRDKSQRGYSRWHWQTFCDVLRSKADPYSGGVAQLVGLYREGNGRKFGVFWNGRGYIDGKLYEQNKSCSELEWRDELFQRVDSNGQLIEGAQKHGRVL